MVPTNLFSHPDQQLEWQNASQSGATSTGWAGRIADASDDELQPGRNGADDYVGGGGYAVLQWGGEYAGVGEPGESGRRSAAAKVTTECAAQQATAQALLQFDSGLSLVQADNTITKNAYNYAQILTAATSSLPALQTVFPANNALASQLKQIAQIIQARAALGVSRQIFFAGIGNFDTHSDQVSAAGNAAGIDLAGAGCVLSGDAGAWRGE